jgi:hypothetical protein
MNPIRIDHQIHRFLSFYLCIIQYILSTFLRISVPPDEESRFRNRKRVYRPARRVPFPYRSAFLPEFPLFERTGALIGFMLIRVTLKFPARDNDRHFHAPFSRYTSAAAAAALYFSSGARFPSFRNKKNPQLKLVASIFSGTISASGKNSRNVALCAASVPKLRTCWRNI